MNKLVSALQSPSVGSNTATDLNAKKTRLRPSDPGYQSALQDRCVFLYDSGPKHIPTDEKNIRAAIFAVKNSPKPSEGLADRVHSLLPDIRNEEDMRSKILMKFLPNDQLEADKATADTANNSWRKSYALDTEKIPNLSPAKPDMTIGWNSKEFPFPRANESLRNIQCPVPSMETISWPLFTAEVKGEKGCLRVAKLQSLHNAALQLSHLYVLMKAASREEEFFDKIHVMSLQLTLDVIQLSYYWATRSEDGMIKYYGNVLKSWMLETQHVREFNQAYSCVHKAIELVRTRAFPTVYSCMEYIESQHAMTKMEQVPSPHSTSRLRGPHKSSGQVTTPRAIETTPPKKADCTTTSTDEESTKTPTSKEKTKQPTRRENTTTPTRTGRTTRSTRVDRIASPTNTAIPAPLQITDAIPLPKGKDSAIRRSSTGTTKPNKKANPTISLDEGDTTATPTKTDSNKLPTRAFRSTPPPKTDITMPSTRGTRSSL